MKRILIVSLCGVCTAIAPAAKADSAKQTVPASTSHPAPKTSAAKKSSAGGTSSSNKSASSSTHKSTTSANAGTAPAKTASSASSKTVRTSSKHGAKGQVARVRRPSYQTVPSPERYQQIQQSLADRGFYKGEVNGVWGPESQDAMKRFQESQNLPDDGKITAKALIGLGLGPNHGTTGATLPDTNQPSATQPGATIPSAPAAATPAPSASPATPTPDPPQPPLV